jgi:ribonucrease Y
VSVLASLIALAIGLAAGLAVTRMSVSRRIAMSRVHSKQLLDAAQARIATLRQETTRRAEAKAREIELNAQEDLKAEEQDLVDCEAELTEREAVATTREHDMSEVEAEAKAAEAAALKVKEEALLTDAERDELIAKVQAKLEEVSGLSREDAVCQLVLERTEKATLAMQILARDREEIANKEAPESASRLMGTIVDRYDGIGHLERIQNTIEIPDEKALAALADTTGPTYAAFTQAINCELLCDVGQKTATVRGDDPLAREVARRALRQLANRAFVAADKIRAIADQVKDEVEHEVQNAGRKAARQLNLRDIHPEILHLVGRLKFRLSYSQNQLKHSIEVATIAGMLAEELGVDPQLARRSGLLHDIGKAMTHDHEGSHALLGAQVARKCGEREDVANAIGSHHNDEPMSSPLAFVVTAADALSGARPGARRESVTQYVSRIEEIQAIAGRSPAVRRVDVMHAGREVRVIVAGEEKGAIDDAERQGGVVLADRELQPLAAEIARTLEKEVTYAGQIRVTVIRESKAVAIAV